MVISSATTYTLQLYCTRKDMGFSSHQKQNKFQNKFFHDRIARNIINEWVLYPEKPHMHENASTYKIKVSPLICPLIRLKKQHRLLCF